MRLEATARVQSERTAPDPGAALSDAEIVRRVLAGEQTLYELLVRRYNQRLYRVARSVLRSDADAEDAVQEAHIAAWRKLGMFEGRSSFGTWLTRIAVRTAIARARPAHTTESSNVMHTPDPRGESPDAAPARDELQGVLAGAADRLPPPLRSVFVLRDVEGLSTDDAAACLGISPDNVKVRLHRARAALRDDIDRRLGDEVRRLYQFAGARCERTVRAVMARITGADCPDESSACAGHEGLDSIDDLV